MNTAVTRAPSIIERPLVSFGREICGDFNAALRREWLVTNGLGGYASGTVAGINTRRYHALLTAALTPCVGRTVMLGTVIEQATYLGATFRLSTNEFVGGSIDPTGYQYLQSFELRGALPVWVYALGDALLERRIWMARGHNTTYVSYQLLRGTGPVELNLTPLVTYRDFHALTSGHGWAPQIEAQPRAAVVRAYATATPFRICSASGGFTPNGEWWWNFYHRAEAARGLDDRSDLFAIGAFTATLAPGEACTLAATAEEDAEMDGSRALAAEQAAQQRLLTMARVHDSTPALQQLVLAADQFLVERWPGGVRPASFDHHEDASNQAVAALSFRSRPGAAGRSVIAGYHWFNDWGRDTMIALPELAISTGRTAEATEILRTFARYVRDGLLPNNFPDESGAVPGYNTADASLWYVLCVRACYEAAADESLLDELLPVLREIVDHHVAGTRFGIGVDPDDGLLRAGEPGVQLTWMDAKVGDWVVTPRTGKPVEINALWYNALCTLAELLDGRSDPSASRYRSLADRALSSFRTRFVRPDSSHLKDVVDGPNGDDLSIRPNQIFAISLPFPLLEGAAAAAVVDAVGRDLLTTYGLRSLAPSDPAYQAHYGGDQRQRDGAYHQGTVWTWLIGPYAEAHYRVHRDLDAAHALLRPFEHHLSDAGLGSISEIMDGDPPHLPRGCIAQAWGVAEVLRVWLMLGRRSGRS